MTSGKQEFETTKGLLNDVMRKQSGSLSKAVLEGVMNSIDANATEVEIKLTENSLSIKDDGDGMTVEDVDNYFKKFGLKDTDIEEKDFGKFRMGRGQIFNFGRNIWHTNDNFLVVSLDEDEVEIELEDETHTLDVEGLSYNHVEASENYDGCQIVVDLYNNLEDVEETVGDIKELCQYISWLHDVKVTINGQSMHNEFNYDFESELAYYKFKDSSFTSRCYIYNQGAKVKSESIRLNVDDSVPRRHKTVPLRATVVTKADLDLNFARNDILDSCDTWELIEEEYVNYAKDFLTKMEDYTDRQAQWLMYASAHDNDLLYKIKGKQLIEDIDGNSMSLNQIGDQKVTFASPGNTEAKRLMSRTDALILNVAFEDPLKYLLGDKQAKSYNEVIDEDMKYEMVEVNEDNISKRRTKNLKAIRWAFDELVIFKDVKPGNASHRDVWQDEDETVFVDKDVLNSPKKDFIFSVLPRVIEVACHDGDTRKEENRTGTFHSKYYDNMSNLGEIQKKIENGSADF